MSNTIHKLSDLGQSIWCDNLSRRMIDAIDTPNPTDSLRSMIDLGIVGITSNPTIFMKAIATGKEYDDRLCDLVTRGLDRNSVYEGLVLADIVDAADVLRPIYEQSNGIDGYASLEVNPHLAYDTLGTVAEARRLFLALSRPNVFIKVPATPQGIPAIETLIGEGINVNVTLIFSLKVHEQVMRAYLAGLRRLAASGGDLRKVASVASFFISRVDTLVDKLLVEGCQGCEDDVRGLAGRAGVANAKLAYARFEQVFDPKGDFGALARQGARVQRPLWASTSTKNPNFPDTKYVDGLVGSRTVNTLPPETILAVLDHGRAQVTLGGVEEAGQVLVQLGKAGIEMNKVTDRLLEEGVQSFTKSFDELFAHLERKEQRLRPVA